ncbi:MAG TPA: saccharopine dehydrogenase C-terminal domain-containing protein [Candidatus Polarisedimenticolaceae bacterium]|nr:saccharopine dehydrogenase C-terminal domain-containing protein [Candidatus Polarisedimenticolaceae bacterium]
MKRVVVLGAGLVSGPLVEYFLDAGDVALTVADREIEHAAAAIAGHPRGKAIALAGDDGPALARLLAACDLVVSLLPAPLHAAVAKVAIEARVPMVTTSYVSPEMRALDSAARDAGVIVLNEAGLDPGIDHMSAMRAIERLTAEGRPPTSFRSCCGGLPAPDANDNPWGYKFSWSPRGVLAAGRSAARYLDDRRVVEIPGEELFRSVAPYDVPGLGRFEVYPNRDALAYVATYGLDGIATMFRGTLRWPGWCATLDVVARLGLLDVSPREWRRGTTYAEFMEAFPAPPAEAAHRLAWAGLFADDPIGVTQAAPIDVLCARLEERMRYRPGERDMIVLRHELGSGGRTFVSSLVAYGGPAASAMARTVALPAALAARLILDRRVALTGVRIPVHREIYEPVLNGLQGMGIVFEETWSTP